MTDSKNQPIQFECPNCLNSITANREQVGVRIICPNCKRSLVVPDQPKVGLFDDLFDEDDNALFEKPGTAATAAEPAGSEELKIELPFESETDESPIMSPVKPIDNSNSDDNFSLGLEDFDDIGIPTLDPFEIAQLESARDKAEGKSAGAKDGIPIDPFKDTDSSPLKIDEISLTTSSQLTAIRCPLCESRLLIPNGTVGTKIKCPDCHSEVDTGAVLAGKQKKTNQTNAKAVVEDPTDFDLEKNAFQLADVDASVKKSFGLETDNWKNEDDIFEKDIVATGEALAPIPIATRPDFSREHRSSDEVDSGELSLAPLEDEGIRALEREISTFDDPFADDANRGHSPNKTAGSTEEYQLQIEDLPPSPKIVASPKANVEPKSPVPKSTSPGKNPKNLDPKNAEPKPPAKPNVAIDSPKEVQFASPYAAPKSERLTPEEAELERNPIGTNLDQLGVFSTKDVAWATKMFTDSQLLVRLGLVSGVLTMAYLLLGTAVRYWNSGGDGALHYALAAMFGFPGLLLFVVGWVAAVACCGFAFESGGNLKPKFFDWSEVTFSDYVSKVKSFGIALWVAALPGVFLGIVSVTLTFPFAAAGLFVSAFAVFLGPLFLLAAYVNESPFMVFSARVNRYAAAQTTHWARFLPASLVSWFLMAIGIGVMYMPTIISLFLGSVLQLLGLWYFSSFTGLYVGLISEDIEKLERAQKKQAR